MKSFPKLGVLSFPLLNVTSLSWIVYSKETVRLENKLLGCAVIAWKKAYSELSLKCEYNITFWFKICELFDENCWPYQGNATDTSVLLSLFLCLRDKKIKFLPGCFNE